MQCLQEAYCLHPCVRLHPVDGLCEYSDMWTSEEYFNFYSNCVSSFLDHELNRRRSSLETDGKKKSFHFILTHLCLKKNKNDLSSLVSHTHFFLAHVLPCLTLSRKMGWSLWQSTGAAVSTGVVSSCVSPVPQCRVSQRSAGNWMKRCVCARVCISLWELTCYRTIPTFKNRKLKPEYNLSCSLYLIIIHLWFHSSVDVM